MHEVIQKSTVWKTPKIIFHILRNSNVLDPFVILYNSPAYIYRKDKELVAFVTIKSFFGVEELGTVYTLPSFRDQQRMKKLLKDVFTKHDKLSILCSKGMIPFYEKFDFVEEKQCGFWFTFRRNLFNILLRPIFGYQLVSMRRK